MIILPISSTKAVLENAGGKGASLSQLSGLGLPVPPGFIITTDAYHTFVEANNLSRVIADCITGVTGEDMVQMEHTSAQIRSAFSSGKLSEEFTHALSEEYIALSSQTNDSQGTAVSVAVRSSATTEDLPELSFAGLQDTFLNIIGEEQLLRTIVDCWSSLWTARAISYRMHNAIPHEQAALAVIVQRMVMSEISGVLFTVNPLTGLLNEMVIDATFGLGEPLVSGQVEPDHYVVDAISGKIRTVQLGTKATLARSKADGGVEYFHGEAAQNQTLQEKQINQLVIAGQKIQSEYGAPQDIEWAFIGSDLYILQSRPITSLFPIPRISLDPLIVWASFGAVQGLVGPMTPLGREGIQRVILGMGKRLGIKINYKDQEVFEMAGERIWTKVSDVIRNPIGNRIIGGFLGFIEPSIGQILGQLATDPHLGAGQGRLKFSTVRRLMSFFLPVMVNSLHTMLQPDQARERFDALLEAYLQTVKIDHGKDRYEHLANLAAFMGNQGGLADALPTLLPHFIPIFAPAIASLNLIEHLFPKNDDNGFDFSELTLEVTRGLPHNVTIEMDLALWETAQIIHHDGASVETFNNNDISTLVSLYRSRTLPEAGQSAVEQFMEKYGMRGVGEIDLGQPRWRENPTSIMQTLQGYLKIKPEFAPDLLYEKGAQTAEEAIELLAAEARRQRGGIVKEKLVRGAARRVRLLMGARESPKFFAVHAMGIVRNHLLEVGDEFYSAGTIDRADDLFFLHVAELEELSHQEGGDWKAIISGRRKAYERELRRRQVPRVLVSDGRTFYGGIGAGVDTSENLTGSPVSPGMVEGIVHVVLDPYNANLSPGEILVCPGTDPAWTPLFMAAGGLVMEVGGMMTHGSVVAREYGIPAVVGVNQATLMLKTGQRIRVDGSTGKISIL